MDQLNATITLTMSMPFTEIAELKPLLDKLQAVVTEADPPGWELRTELGSVTRRSNPWRTKD